MDSLNVIYGLYCACADCEREKPNKVRYVGQTCVGVEQRFRKHIQPREVAHPTPLGAWKRKHGRENIKYIVLEELDTVSELDAAEIKWIADLETFTDNHKGGLNRSTGGRVGGTFSEVTRQRLKEANSKDTTSWTKAGFEAAGEMRERYRAGDRVADIARDYGLSKAHVHSIISNQTWYDPEYVYRVVFEPKPNSQRKTRILSEDQVKEMRDQYQRGQETIAEIASRFRVSVGTAQPILANKRNYDPEYTPGRPMTQRQKDRISRGSKGKKKPPGFAENASRNAQGSRHPMSKLTEADVIAIRYKRKSGVSSKDIAEEYGVNRNQVNRIVSGARWGHVKGGL